MTVYIFFSPLIDIPTALTRPKASLLFMGQIFYFQALWQTHTAAEFSIGINLRFIQDCNLYFVPL